MKFTLWGKEYEKKNILPLEKMCCVKLLSLLQQIHMKIIGFTFEKNFWGKKIVLHLEKNCWKKNLGFTLCEKKFAKILSFTPCTMQVYKKNLLYKKTGFTLCKKKIAKESRVLHFSNYEKKFEKKPRFILLEKTMWKNWVCCEKKASFTLCENSCEKMLWKKWNYNALREILWIKKF